MRNKSKGYDEKAIVAMLSHYKCSAPYHKVRTIFLGSIASPGGTISPTIVIDVIKGLWGGEFPPFESMEACQEFLNTLTTLWNHLARHQSPNAPFRLTRPTISNDARGLLLLARTRIEELEGFIDALFAGQPEIRLPESSISSMNHLKEVASIIMGIPPLFERIPDKEAEEGASDTIANIHKLSKIIEENVHDIVVSCHRTRGNMLEMKTANEWAH